MTFLSKLTPEQWAEARVLRADGASFAAIAERFGLSPATIALRARRECWAKPAGAAPAAAPTAAGKTRRAPASPATAGIRRSLAGRLYNVLEIRIRMMELHMLKQLQALQDGEQPSPAGADERAEFIALIKNIEQVTELCSDTDRAAGGRGTNATAAGAGSADALAAASAQDAFRREIAERLEKLFPPS